MPKTRTSKTPATTMKWDGSDPEAAVAWLLEFGGSAAFRESEEVTETAIVDDPDPDNALGYKEEPYIVGRPARIIYLHDGIGRTAQAGDTLYRTVPEQTSTPT
jgi:hypothetical protein